MPPRRPQKASVPPTLSPAQAIPLLIRQRDRADAVAQARRNGPEGDVWVNSTVAILDQAFGKPDGEPHHQNTRDFMGAHGLPIGLYSSEHEFQQSHQTRTMRRKALLEGFIEQLKDLAPPHLQFCY